MADAEDGATRVVTPTPATPASMPAPGPLPEIMGYKVIRPLGEGGMAQVYLAEDLSLGRQVAIKIMTSALLSDPGFRSRFDNEARILAGFRHQYIVTVYASGEIDGHPYIAMEYVAGHTLEQRLRENGGKLPQMEAIRIARKITGALAYAHERNVIHRDIKPSNILFTNERTPVLADFGIAKSMEDAATKTRTGFIVGSPRYMAPEQLMGRPVSDKVDIYALGLILYEMLEGTIPDWVASSIHGKEDRRKLRSQMSPENRRLADVVGKCLATDPAERPTASELRRELIALSRVSRLPSWPWIAGAAALVILAAGAYLLWQPSTTSEGTAGSSGAAVSPLPERTKIAVLPFQNMGSDEESRYLVEGMTIETIVRLARMDPERLVVIGAGTTAAYRETERPLSEIASELGVDYILKGSVQFGNDMMRVTAELTRTKDMVNVWVDSWDQKHLDDILSVRDELAAKIASALSLNLLTPETGVKQSSAPMNPQAFAAYVKGRSLWEERSSEKLLRAKAEFEKAIALDGRYAAAYAGLADTYNMLARYGVMPAEDAFEAADRNARKAIELDDGIPEGHVALAYTQMHDQRDWASAERSFRKALDLDPTYALAWQWYGRMLSALGRHDEAVRSVARAVELEPGLAVVRAALCQAQYYAGDLAAAAKTCGEAISLDATFARAHANLTRVFEQQKQWDKAEEHALFGTTVTVAPATTYPAVADGGAEAVVPLSRPIDDLDEGMFAFDIPAIGPSAFVQQAQIQFTSAAGGGIAQLLHIDDSDPQSAPVRWQTGSDWKAEQRGTAQRTPDISELVNTTVSATQAGAPLQLRIRIGSAAEGSKACSDAACGLAVYGASAQQDRVPHLELTTEALSPQGNHLEDLVCINAGRGLTQRARGILSSLQPVGSPYAMAEALACLGDAPGSLDYLKRAANDSDPQALLVNVEPRFAAVRDDQKFRDYIKDDLLAGD